jgi:hypothetical protein
LSIDKNIKSIIDDRRKIILISELKSSGSVASTELYSLNEINNNKNIKFEEWNEENARKLLKGLITTFEELDYIYKLQMKYLSEATTGGRKQRKQTKKRKHKK